jgi:hypothetical protein
VIFRGSFRTRTRLHPAADELLRVHPPAVVLYSDLAVGSGHGREADGAVPRIGIMGVLHQFRNRDDLVTDQFFPQQPQDARAA